MLDLCGQTAPDSVQGRSALRLLAGEPDGWRNDAYLQNVPYSVNAA